MVNSDGRNPDQKLGTSASVITVNAVAVVEFSAIHLFPSVGAIISWLTLTASVVACPDTAAPVTDAAAVEPIRPRR